MLNIVNNNSYRPELAVYNPPAAPVAKAPETEYVDQKVQNLKRVEERLRIQHRAHGDALPGSEMRFQYSYGPDGKRYVVNVIKEQIQDAASGGSSSQEQLQKTMANHNHASSNDPARQAKELGTVKAALVESLKAKLADTENRMESLDGEYDHLMEMEVAELRRVDADVRAHEATHARVGGALAGPPRYQYQLGPDGKMYAVGGEVTISMPRGRTPEETIRIMSTVKAAATAVGDPSPADMRAASYAARRIHQAMQEVRRMQQQEMSKQDEKQSSAVDKKD